MNNASAASLIERSAETLMNTAAHAIGYDCHVMVGADAASHLGAPEGGFLGFSMKDHGKGDREFRALGITVIVSPLRVPPRSA